MLWVGDMSLRAGPLLPWLHDSGWVPATQGHPTHKMKARLPVGRVSSLAWPGFPASTVLVDSQEAVLPTSSSSLPLAATVLPSPLGG